MYEEDIIGDILEGVFSFTANKLTLAIYEGRGKLANNDIYSYIYPTINHVLSSAFNNVFLLLLLLFTSMHTRCLPNGEVF